MRIAIITLTKKGSELGYYLYNKFECQVYLFIPEKYFKNFLKTGQDLKGDLSQALDIPGTLSGGKLYFFKCPLRDLAGYLFSKVNGFIFIMATGIVVRIIAPLLKDKRTDPAVVVMDERGRFVISLLSGHLGGANELAKKVAKFVGAQEVITTATDVNQTLAIDMLAKELNMVCEPFESLKKINAALADEQKVSIFTEVSLPDLSSYKNIKVFSLNFLRGDITEGGKRYTPSFEEKLGELDATVFITNKIVDPSSLKDISHIFLRPKNLVAGIGCKKGVGIEEIIGALSFVFNKEGLAMNSLKALASVELKQNEQGLLEAARRIGIEIKFFSVEELASCAGNFRESVFVKNVVGVGAVCEPAAWLAAKRQARLIISKTICQGVTVAVAEESYR